jgi:aminopeptidase N
MTLPSARALVPCVVLLAACGSAPVVATPQRRDAAALAHAPAVGLDVLHYDTHVIPDMAGKRLSGTMRIRFRVRAPTTAVELDSGSLEIDSIRHGARRLRFSVQESRLRVEWPSPIQPGSEYEIDIAYHGAPRSGLAFVPEREQVFTTFSTSDWMVAIDAPSDRATLRLRLTVPADWRAAGSGELATNHTASGLTTHEWRLDTPAPTYTFGFAAGRFTEATQQTGRVALRYLGGDMTEDELARVFRDTPDMLAFFESRAGVPYPAESYTQVLTAHGIGQEKSSLAILPEDYGRGVLADAQETWLSAHELAHQWWGNMVTCRDWRHFWLNEGFATFMVAADKEHRYGRESYLAEIEKIRARYERVRDMGKDRSLVFTDWDHPTADDRTIVYQKGAYVLHLLREALGDDIFWHGIQSYTQTHLGRSVLTADFQASMEQAARRSLQGFFDMWVYGPAPEDVGAR